MQLQGRRGAWQQPGGHRRARLEEARGLTRLGQEQQALEHGAGGRRASGLGRVLRRSRAELEGSACWTGLWTG